MFLDYFDVLISKITFKKLKNILFRYIKSTLKSNHNHTKQSRPIYYIVSVQWFFFFKKLVEENFLPSSLTILNWKHFPLMLYFIYY
jgi:hypothetical protein